MVQRIVAAGLMAACMVVAACNTVRGAAADINSAANCTENAIKSGYCK